ncbi:MAG: hypothetical protein V2J19_06705 [Wenzhouxiangella sp.]|jgi:hypothetical protein|nr:hypothetical protein [Wenzhouxiangella sp.]
MRLAVVASFLFLLSACAASSQKDDAGTPDFEQWHEPLTEAERREIEEVEAQGRILYRKDAFAARATDVLLEAVDLGAYPDFVGWVGYERGPDFVVSFYERSGSEVSLVGDVVFSEGGSPAFELEPDRALTDREVSMLNARMAALEAGRKSCSDRFNTVVMPSGPDEQAWTVYVLAATTQPGVMLVGGHSRVRVDKQSAEVLDVKSLSKSCLKLGTTRGRSDVPEGSILVFTHLISPLPIPVYPYLSLLHREALAVSSRRGNWMIRGDDISFIEM